MNALLLSTFAAALTPQVRSGGSTPATRRAALQGATAAIILPAGLSFPQAATARGAVEDGKEAGLGGVGALRSDLPESLTGSGVEILISDLSYKELDACPKGFFIPPKGGPWSCIEISATAYNQGKREVKAADVFGQIYDSEGYSPAATSLDPSQKAPLTSLEYTFPKGVKVPVKWVAAVQARSPRPFRFAAMKANYRSANMAKTFKTFDACEIDSSACDEDEDQPENAYALRSGQGLQYNYGDKK
jgi:hypothetical protein